MRIRDWDVNLKIRLFGEAAMNITFWMFFPFLTIYFAEAFGKGTAGFLLVLSQAFSVIANLLGGYSADRFGRKKMMVLSAFGQGICFLIFALTTSPVIGFIAFAFVSFFSSIYWPASQAMVADVVSEKDRSNVFAVFYTSINIAVVVGPLLGAIFYTNYFSELLFICSIICLGLAFTLAKWTTETAPAVSRQKQLDDRWHYFLFKQFKDYGIIFKDKIFMLFMVAGVLASQTFMQLDLLFPLYIKDVVHNQTLLSVGDWAFKVGGEQAFGIVLAFNGLLVAIFTVSVTKWMTKYVERNVFVLSSVMYAISILLFGQTQWIWGLLLAMLIFTFGELMVAGLQQSFISRISPEHMRGQYFAAASLRYTLGKTIAPMTIPLTVWIGYQWTFFVLSLLALTSACLYWLMFSFIQKRKPLYFHSNVTE